MGRICEIGLARRTAARAISPAMPASRPITITALGITQILGYGTSFYFPAVLAPPIVADTGWSLGFVVSGTSIGLLVAGLITPKACTIIEAHGGRPAPAARHAPR